MSKQQHESAGFVVKVFMVATIMGILIALCFGCSPQKNLSRILRKHPELAKLDTNRVYTSVNTPLPHIDVRSADSSFKALQLRNDSLLQLIRDRLTPYSDCDSAIQEIRYQARASIEQARNETERRLANYRFLQDTVFQDKNGVRVKVYQVGRELKIDIDIPAVTKVIKPGPTAREIKAETKQVRQQAKLEQKKKRSSWLKTQWYRIPFYWRGVIALVIIWGLVELILKRAKKHKKDFDL